MPGELAPGVLTEGEQLAWVTEGLDELDGELPAMLANVDSAVLAVSAAPSQGLPTSVIVTLAVALAAAAGGGAMAFSLCRGTTGLRSSTRRRCKPNRASG